MAPDSVDDRWIVRRSTRGEMGVATVDGSGIAL